VIEPLFYAVACATMFYYLSKDHELVKKDSAWKQLQYGLYSIFALSPFSMVIQYLVVTGYMGKLYEDPLHYGWAYLLLQFPLFVFASDTLMYWSHRMLHTKQLFWIHKGHHSYLPISSFISNAADLKDHLLLGLPCTVIPLVIFPFYTNVFAGVGLFVKLWTIYIHSPTAFSLTSDKSVIANNQFHLKRHLTFTGNYGVYLTFWDRVCGTSK
jgi:lathosterol oxidase